MRSTPFQALNPRRFARPLSVAAAVAAVLAAKEAPLASAAVLYWDGTGNAAVGAGTGWDAASSWSTVATTTTDDPAAPPGAADVATFPTPVANTDLKIVNLNNNQSALGLTFTAPQVGTDTSLGYFLRGGDAAHTLNLGTSGIVNSGGPVTIGSTTAGQQVNISLAGSQNWSSTATGQALFILNNVSAGVSGATTLTLDGTNTGTKIDGIISDGSGTLALNKVNGIGKWNLNGANTFSGGVTLTAGTLSANNATALGTGTLTITGGSLDSTTASGGLNTANNAQVWNGNFGYAGTAAYNIGTGAVSLGTTAGTARTVTVSGNTFTVGGVISNGATATGITKAGAGTLVLAGSNLYTGTNTLTAGTLGIASFSNLGGVAGGNTLIFNGGTLQVIGTGITGFGTLPVTINNGVAVGIDVATAGNTFTFDKLVSGTGSFVKAGVGTAVLTGTQTYSGATSLNGGVLSVAAAANLGNTSGFNLNSGLLSYTGTTDLTLAQPITLTSGTGGGGFDNSGSALLTVSGGIANPGAASVANSKTFVLSGSGNGILTGNLVNATAGSSLILGLTKNGAGTWTLNGTNTYTGTTTLNGGTLVAGVAGALGTNANVLASTTTATTLDLGGLNQTIGSLSGGFTGSQVALGAGTLTLGAATSTTYTGAITGTGGITKVGAGTQTLTAGNTYTGVTTLNAGILNIRDAAGLGAGSTVLGQGTVVASGAQLQLQGGITVAGEALSITGGASGVALLSVSGNNEFGGPITINGTAGNYRVGSDAGRLTLSGNFVGSTNSGQYLVTTGVAGDINFTGVLSGASGLINQNGGVLTLAGANTYTGQTNLQLAGVVAVTSLNSVNTNATLGTVHSASSSLGAPTTVAAGTINFSFNSSAINGTLRYLGTGEVSDRGLALNGGAGTATVEAAGTGTLKLVGDVSNTTVAGAKTLALTGVGNGEIAGNILAAGVVNNVVTGGITGILKTGAGTWTISGTSNAFAGPTSVTGGTLRAASENAFGSTSSVAVSGGGSFLLNAGFTNRVNDSAAATVSVSGGTLGYAAGTTANSETMGALNLGSSAIIDFGATSGNTAANTLLFNSLTLTGGGIKILNWTGSIYNSGATGTGLASDDHFLFTLDPNNLSAAGLLTNVSFYSDSGSAFLGYGTAVTYGGSGGGYELVASVPEPSALLSVLLGGSLLGLRRRRV